MQKFGKNASAVRFLLGGIGTGNISLNQNARLCDFELFTRPNKGYRLPYTFFAVRTESPDGTVLAKALESQLAPPFDHSHGTSVTETVGLPRFAESEMEGNYPFVNFKLTDKNMPIEAGLESFTPLIPLNTDDSSLPVAIMRYKVKNISDTPLTVSIAGSMGNVCNYKKVELLSPVYEGEICNDFVKGEYFQGMHFKPVNKPETDLDYFEMAMLTTEAQKISYLDYWHEGAWWDGLQDFWNDFTSDGELTSGRELRGKGNRLHRSNMSVASLCVKKELQPGEEAPFEFLISWYRPNRLKTWDQLKTACECNSGCGCGPDTRTAPIVRNYYAKFGPALKSAEYVIKNITRLESDSRKFASALYSSTLPEYVLDAISANITVIRSTTCFRVEDGMFFGWEGCGDTWGCCDGTCTHVWNYAQTMAFLFPELERYMRRMEFLYETDDEGKMRFRAHNYFNDVPFNMPPATDGQLGTIVRLYREWKLCGDDAFIKELWPKAKSALEYASTFWDTDGDGLLDGEQHNTYDIEFHGVSSMLNTMFFAALRAGEEISQYLGDNDSAQKYAALCQKGAEKLDKLTFNGEFYEQILDDVNEHKYQYGKGCLADQLFGQQLAHVCGLGHLMNVENVKSAVHSIYKYNFLEDFSQHANLQRVYALNQNGGLLLCSWPKGERPEIPFVYSDEVWTGIEYQVATHLIYEGFVEEGLKIVKACRDRHDGVERNPWNEFECGHHYARSLASYGVLLALTGFNCDAVAKTLKFDPAINQKDFSAFFCCADGWGMFKFNENGEKCIETLYGDLSGYKIL